MEQKELSRMTEQESLRYYREAYEREAYNPYSKEKMKEYLEHIMGDEVCVASDKLPMESKRDLLCTLSAVAYGEENGYLIRLKDGYIETNQMILRRFEIVREEDR